MQTAGRVALAKTPTSQGNCNAMHRSRGFTLIELTIVLALLSLLFVVVGPNFEAMRENQEYRSTIRNIVSAAKDARSLSIRSHTPVDLIFLPGERRFWVLRSGALVENADFQTIPESLELAVTSAAELRDVAGASVIRFYPSGGSSGGDVEILRGSGTGTLLQISWLLGDVRQISL